MKRKRSKKPEVKRGSFCVNTAPVCIVGDWSVTCLQAAGGAQGEFIWDEVQQSVILSSFFWGYLIFQVPGGRIAEVVGAKRVFGGAVLINGALSLVLPFLARTHWVLLLVTRALQGLAQVRHKHETTLWPSDTDKTSHVIGSARISMLQQITLLIWFNYVCIQNVYTNM
jgi:MFS family permease